MSAVAVLHPAQPEVTVTEVHVLKEAVPATVTLTMSLKAAQALRLVCHHTGGFPNGPRGDMDSISKALDAAGVRRLVANVGINEHNTCIWLGSTKFGEPQ